MNIFTILAYKALFDWINKADSKENENHYEMEERHKELKQELRKEEENFLNSYEWLVSKEDIDNLIKWFNI